jgi:hypothetical protein
MNEDWVCIRTKCSGEHLDIRGKYKAESLILDAGDKGGSDRLLEKSVQRGAL